MAVYTYKLSNALVEEGVNTSLLVDDLYELDHLPSDFNKIKVLSSRNMGPMLKGGKVCRVANIIFAHVYNWFQLFLFIKKNNPTIIHIQPQFYLLDWFGFWLLNMMGKKTVVTIHDVVPHKYFTTCFQWLEKKILRYIYEKADRLIVHAEANKKQFEDVYRLDSQKVAVIPIGEFSLSEMSRKTTEEDARIFLRVQPSHKVLLFFGYIRENKGLDLLLQAFDDLSKRYEELILVIAGSLIQNATFDGYDSLLKKMKHSDRVRCFIRYIDHDEIPLFFLPSDIVVLPYRQFGSQSAVVQLAQGFGKPIVATDIGGLPEAIEHGKSGLIVPVGETEGLVEAISYLVENGRLREEMGREAIRASRERFSWRQVAQETLTEVYNRLAESGSCA